MEVQASVLQGAAFMAGLGAEFFGATETVIGGGHYVADGLRKVADGVDWVTEQGQEFCRNRKVSCVYPASKCSTEYDGLRYGNFRDKDIYKDRYSADCNSL